MYDERDYAEEAWQRDNGDEKREAAAETTGMTPQESVDAARQAVADWNDGRSAGPAGQALRDAVVGLLDLRAKDTDKIGDLVEQLDAALAARDQAAGEHARQLAQVAIKTGVVLAERGEEIAALTKERDRLKQQYADDMNEWGRVAGQYQTRYEQAEAERYRLAARVRVLADAWAACGSPLNAAAFDLYRALDGGAA